MFNILRPLLLLYFGTTSMVSLGLFIGTRKYPETQRSLLPLVLGNITGLCVTYNFASLCQFTHKLLIDQKLYSDIIYR